MQVNKHYLILVLQYFLGAVFIFSGVVKLSNPNDFHEALVNFKLFSNEITDFIEYLIPSIEIVLGLLVIFNFSSSLPSLFSSFLLSLFTAIIITKLFEGEEISNGCFGNYSNDKLDFYSVLRNLILILISLIISISLELRKNAQTPQNRNERIRIINLILVTNLFFYLSVQNIIFAMQNAGLKSRLALLVQDENILKKGELVKSFRINDMEGKEVLVKYPKNLRVNTLLFLLKPSCSPCKINLPNWKTLFSRLNKLKTRIYAISLDKYESTINCYHEQKLYFPIFYITNNEFLINYKAFLTPQTILINKTAEVVQVWKGILDEAQINEINNLSNKSED